MAITRVQQTQISGSLSYDDSLAAGSALAGKSTLVGDLNALRSQLNKVIGKTNWFDALDGSQDLADIYAAVHMTGTAADFQGALDVTGVATFDSAITGSAGLQLAGDADFNSSLDVAGAVSLAASGLATSVRGTLSVSEKADFAGIVDVASTLSASAIKIDGDTAQRLYIVDADGSIKDEANLVYDASNLIVKSSGVKLQDGLGGQKFLVDSSGNMDVKGNTVLSGSLKISADATPGRVYIVGQDGEVVDSSALTFTMADGFQVSGKASISNGLTVGGILDVNNTLSASAVKIDSDVAGRLYMVGSEGEIMDQAQLTFELGSLAVKTSMGVSQFSVNSTTGDVSMEGDLEVKGNDIKSSTATAMTLSGADVEIKGDLTVTGNDIKSSTATAMTLSGADVEVLGDLKVSGNDIKSSTGAVVLELAGDDAFFKSDVHVAGDLYVKGAMTYIETTNLKVKDAFIHLATGSAGSDSSGIVLHGGAGASADLMLAQDGGAGEFVFAKVAAADHDNIDSDNIVGVNGAELVAAWMSSVKLGSAEGSLSGSLAASVGGIELKAEAGKSLVVEAGSDLSLKANGFTLDLGTSAQYTTFDSNFTATTIVGALNELYAAGAGGSKKGNLSVANVNVATGVLTFSSIGTLASASQQFVDVYLNGVLLAYGKDVDSVTTTSITLAAGIASSLIADDCLTVVLRGAA